MKGRRLMKIPESKENYLETIFMLKQKNGFVRSIDVAQKLNFSKASVSVAMKSLKESGLVTVAEDGGISLTENGFNIASSMYERHELIAKILISLGVCEETAYEDSCRIEHVISDESFEKIKEFYSKDK